MTDIIRFTIPFPPSINHYYQPIRHGKFARTIKSKTAREYPYKVKAAIFWPHPPLDGDLYISLHIYPPTRHRRDVDNYNKAVLDAFTFCGVWHDDSQVVQCCTTIHKVGKFDDSLKGRVRVSIIECEGNKQIDRED